MCDLFRWTTWSLVLAALTFGPVHAAASMESASDATSDSFIYEKIVAYGAVVDAAGSKFVDGRFDLRALNNLGQIALQSTVTDAAHGTRTGLWIFSPSEYRELAYEPANAFLLGDTRPFINDRLQGAMRRFTLAADDLTRLTTLTALSMDGRLIDVIRQGDRFGQDSATVVDVSLTPTINSLGDVGTVIRTVHGVEAGYSAGYFTGSDFHVVAAHGDHTQYGGDLLLNIGPLPPAWVNDRRQVCFTGYLSGDVENLRYGTFRVTGTTLEKVALSGDMMPNGELVQRLTGPQGTMNNDGDVAFEAQLDGDADSGVFVFSDAATTTVYTEGDESPLGGPFLSLGGSQLGAAGPYLDLPIINDLGSVLFKVRANNANGKSRVGLFLWRKGQAAVKIVAIGDRMLDGRRVHRVGYYSLNDNDQVAFSVTYKSKKGKMTESIYLATPM